MTSATDRMFLPFCSRTDADRAKCCSATNTVRGTPFKPSSQPVFTFNICGHRQWLLSPQI